MPICQQHNHNLFCTCIAAYRTVTMTVGKTRQLEVRNRLLNVFVRQSPGAHHERPTLFFLHGSMANHKQFERLIENFQGDYNIVAWDAYGCGQSDKPEGWEEYSADEHLDDAIAILQLYKSSTNHLICHRYAHVCAPAIRQCNLLLLALGLPKG